MLNQIPPHTAIRSVKNKVKYYPEGSEALTLHGTHGEWGLSHHHNCDFESEKKEVHIKLFWFVPHLHLQQKDK